MQIDLEDIERLLSVERKFEQYREMMDKAVDAMVKKHKNMIDSIHDKSYVEKMGIGCSGNCSDKDSINDYLQYKIKELEDGNKKLSQRNQKLANELDRIKGKIECCLDDKE